ncbi:hypothetical protein SAMN04488005_1762 [Yoonia tamlensis]|uniref:Uncharacterized protein n=1 Tax=Yoonia tamlensis TaxID=390270 RepID=A0A1I6GJL3_9RHOB|nr:hypothetical protein SAMN04488005_1762 [Yoonia tamlensis]
MEATSMMTNIGLPGLVLLLGALNPGGIVPTALFTLITSAAVMTGIH